MGQTPGRPAWPPHFATKLRGVSPELKIKPYQDGFCKSHKKGPKGLNQVEWRSKFATTQGIKAQFNRRSNMGQEINVSVQNEPETSQSQAGRPASNCRRWSHATATDFQRTSRASLQRRWPRSHIPRPAGLGEAGRPHMSASDALPCRGRQAQ